MSLPGAGRGEGGEEGASENFKQPCIEEAEEGCWAPLGVSERPQAEWPALPGQGRGLLLL